MNRLPKDVYAFFFILEYCKENKIANFPVVRYYSKGIHIEDVTTDNNPSPELFIKFLEKRSQKDEL